MRLAPAQQTSQAGPLSWYARAHRNTGHGMSTTERVRRTQPRSSLALRPLLAAAMLAVPWSCKGKTESAPVIASVSNTASNPAPSAELRPALAEPRWTAPRPHDPPSLGRFVQDNLANPHETKVRLVTHHVSVAIRDGLARTHVVEVFRNDGPNAATGSVLVPFPPGASLAGVSAGAEGELHASRYLPRTKKASANAAPLRVHHSGPSLILGALVVPAEGSWQLEFDYDQRLSEGNAGFSYRYPLATLQPLELDEFSFRGFVTDRRRLPHSPHAEPQELATTTEGGGLSFSMTRRGFTPVQDLILRFQVAHRSPLTGVFHPQVTGGANAGQNWGYFVVELPVTTPQTFLRPPSGLWSRSLLLDRSHARFAEAADTDAQLAQLWLDELTPDEPFALITCHTECEAFPEAGTVAASDDNVHDALRWLRARGPRRGASNLAAGLARAYAAVANAERAQIAYVGSGKATVDETSPEGILARLAAPDKGELDLRFLTTGVADGTLVPVLAKHLDAFHTHVSDYDPNLRAGRAFIGALFSSRITDLALIAPATVEANLRAVSTAVPEHERVLVTGRYSEPGTSPFSLRGRLAGELFSAHFAIDLTSQGRDNPLVPRHWALQEVAKLQTQPLRDVRLELIDLSRKYHIASVATRLELEGGGPLWWQEPPQYGDASQFKQRSQEFFPPKGYSSTLATPPKGVTASTQVEHVLEKELSNADAPHLEQLCAAHMAQYPDNSGALAWAARELLGHGRLQAAQDAASRLLELEPDNLFALLTHAEASAALGEAAFASYSLSAAAGSARSDPQLHLRAAKALGTLGHHAESCAHYRSASSLLSHSDTFALPPRCAQVASPAEPASPADNATSPTPLPQPALAGWFTAEVECIDPDGCPYPVIGTPEGHWLSPYSPPPDTNPSARSVALGTPPTQGTYRVLVVGGRAGTRGRLTVNARGSHQSVDFTWQPNRPLQLTSLIGVASNSPLTTPAPSPAVPSPAAPSPAAPSPAAPSPAAPPASP